MRSFLILGCLLGACSGDDTETGVDETGTDTDTGTTEPASDYVSGQYRLTSFVLLEEGQGRDLDEDGEPDNNLPNALAPVDLIVSDMDLSRDGLNTRVADSLDSFLMNVLLDAEHSGNTLTLEVLAGLYDEEAETMAVDPGSYDAQGVPTTMTGAFESQTAFSAGATTARIPVTFFEGEPPIPVPLERAQIIGDLSAEGSTGLLVGVIPSELLVDEVIAQLIPEEGYDSNGDGEPDIAKDALLESIRTIAKNPNIADIWLGDDRFGISAAFEFEAGVATWTDEQG